MTTTTWTIRYTKRAVTLMGHGRTYRLSSGSWSTQEAWAMAQGFARGRAMHARMMAAALERDGLIGRRSSAAHRLARIWDARADEIKTAAR